MPLLQHNNMKNSQFDMSDLVTISATELYMYLLSLLTEKELNKINSAPDDNAGEVLMRELFVQKTGLTPEEFVAQFRTLTVQQELKKKT